MRETSSTHVVSVTASANQSWEANAAKANMIINIPYLSKVIRNTTISDNSSKIINGKRKPHASIQSTRRTKRTKASQGSSNDNVDDSDEDEGSNSSDDDASEPEDYPVLEDHRNHRKPDSGLVPVLRHVLEIQYTKNEKPTTHNEKWDDENKKFQDILSTLSDSSSSHNAIDVGNIRFAEYRGSAVAVSYNPHCQSGSDRWLFLVPSLVIDRDSNDLRSSSSSDLLLACRTLQGFGQAYVEASLKLVVLPFNTVDTVSGQLPFALQLEFIVSLVLPLVLDPIPLSRRAQILAREDAQRRLLRAIYISQDITSQAVNDEVTVSTLYSILRSAPPLPSEGADKALQPESLIPTLLPFQRRSVAWMLEKEGMMVNEEGSIVPQKSSDNFSFWKEVKEGIHTLYLNSLSGELSENPPEPISVPFGGILAEEPGLGKTVETIALILLNPAPAEYNPTLTRWDPHTSLEVKAVKTTLIVTPPSLAGQWKEEFEKHAPSLKVLMYDGWSKVKVPITALGQLQNMKEADSAKPKKKKPKGKAAARDDAMDVDSEEIAPTTAKINDDSSRSNFIAEWPCFVHGYDVVITTYQTLRSDLYVAHPDPERPRRTVALYDRPRSPLVMVEWKRVVMDEVQMVGGGKAQEMVSLIPRLSSFAVSGTPVKTQMADLIHVLRFLRVDKIVGGPRLWKRLLKPGFTEEFAEFLQRYAIRTIKSNITAELTIPQQTRYLVPIELGKVERHVYDQTLEAILELLGLDARGVAASAGWQVDSNLLRSSIRRLRGMCTHPQVGTLQRKGDSLYKPGALKTMDDVLEMMRDQNWRNLMEEWKTKIQSLVRHSQLQQLDEANKNRYQSALETLDLAEKDTQKHLEEIQTVLARHDAKGKEMKAEAARLRQARVRLSSPDITATQKGKGKERERFIDNENEGEDEDEDDSSEHNNGEDDPEDKDLPKTPAGEEHRAKRRAIKQRLREGQLALHRVKFLQGDVYHILGKSAEEDAAYQAAENLRRELLKAAEADANKAIEILGSNATRKCLSHAETLIELPVLQLKGGIRSADLIEEFNTLIEDVLNKQADLLWEWRERIMVLLSRPLTQKDQADGEEYQRTLDDQGEAEMYLQAYAALLADRRVALINERTLLAAHDVREKHRRHTKAAFKAAHADTSLEDELEILDGLDVQPEHEVLHKDLSNNRKDILVRLEGRAIKSILVDLNGAAAKIPQHTHPEKIIIKEVVENIRRFISDQSALQDKLDGDLALLRRVFNQRILYFRQLQEISDAVTDVTWEAETIFNAINASSIAREVLEAKLNTTRARQRYLDHLVNNYDKADDDEDDGVCILCRCDFTRGYITQCAHVFCEGCMRAWLVRKEGKTCPVCRVTVKPNTVQRFTVDAVKFEPPPQPKCGEAAPQSKRKITYNAINPSIFSDIQTMETYGDYGSKIQTLVRHLLYLKLIDGGAKSIVFSAWADSLHIVEWALKENGIRCLRIDQKSKNQSAANVFRTNPDVLVLLLHGERENAGLNLTCASRVFLLESVVQHSFEIQAIARIDRLGQTRPTEVYCYYAEDTIERNILDLAARKGLSLYTKENSSGSLNVSSFSKDNETAIDDPGKRKALQRGDFIHKIDDMLAILFPHMFEEIEYLIPSTDITDCDVEMTNFDAPRRILTGIEINAIAGPSRAQ